jgi:formylglycine-generating enzyme required for sulfatase activity
LPEEGTKIRGQMRSHDELLAASGYGARPRDFEDLMRILDTTLRLVTPTDPEGVESGGWRVKGEEAVGGGRRESVVRSPSSVATDHGPRIKDNGLRSTRYYQLTHDYLVPALRQWLTRKQRETLRGRAELRLADRAALWQSRPQTRFLPSWYEWLDIVLFTPRRGWTEPQRQMMRKATQYHVARTGILAVVFAVLALAAWQGYGYLRADALVRALASAETTDVPKLVGELKPYRRWSDSMLTRVAADAPDASKERLHAALALADDDPAQVDFLRQRLLQVNRPDDLFVIREALDPHKEQVVPALWSFLEQSHGDADQRFRAACALAAYSPDDVARWEKIRAEVANKLVTENVFVVAQWKKALQPVHGLLLQPLAAIFQDRQRSETDRDTAASLLADYASDKPELIAELVMDADSQRQYASLFARLQENQERARELMTGELARPLAPDPGGKEEAAARRKAQAAVALLQLGQIEPLEALLRRGPDPRVRGWFVHRLGPLGTEPRALMQWREQEQDPGVQSCLLLGLGELDSKISAGERNELTGNLFELYRKSPDPGLRSAVEWLLRRWGKGAELTAIDAELVSERPTGGRRWYVTKHHHTLAVIDGPVEFQMGSPAEEKGRDDGDQAVHPVRLSRGFAIATKKVSRRQFEEFLKQCPNATKWEPGSYSPDPDGPVVQETWYDAAMYCRWLSEQEGIPEDQQCYPPIDQIKAGMRLPANHLSRTGYRLPTEAEWEYACRAGTVTSRYYGSADELLTQYAWCQSNADDRAWPAARLKPNDLGLFDPLGNAWEWCEDKWHDAATWKDPENIDPDDVDPLSNRPEQGSRATRGGSFAAAAKAVRAASRNACRPRELNDAMGFRVTRTYR